MEVIIQTEIKKAEKIFPLFLICIRFAPSRWRLILVTFKKIYKIGDAFDVAAFCDCLQIQCRKFEIKFYFFHKKKISVLGRIRVE